MPNPGEVIYEDAEQRHIYVSAAETRVEWKAGSPEHNRQQIVAKATAARARMRQIANAANFTAAQRDQAIKDVARANANIIALLLDELDSAGD